MRAKVRSLIGVLLALVLLLPLLMLWVARVYENELVRHTEELLIAESVVVGEAYRRAIDPTGAEAELAVPLDPRAERYHPFRAELDIRRSPILPPARRDETVVVTATQAGSELTALLERTLVRNLSGIRVLDGRGIVVASPLKVIGYSLAHLEEVQAALIGRYEPVLRQRYTDDPNPPLGSLSRASTVRVSIAVPIYADPRSPAGEGSRVIGAIYDSRTPLDVSRSLWRVRDDLYLPAALSLVITVAIAAFLAATLSRPLSRIRRAAERVAAGERGGALDPGPFAPQEIHALSESLGKMRAQLEARTDYIREFAANTAHELKTPLTSLRGAAELLLEEDSAMSEEQRRRFLTNIHSDAVRTDLLVQRILHLAHIESAAPERERIDLRAFLGGIVERYQRHGHDLALRYEARDAWIHMNLEQLESLVTNLLDNAVRHGAGKRVDVTVEDDGRGRVLTVRDRGPKLPAEHFERIFERFYTTARACGGTGLGLAIVKAIADGHGGSVTVERHEEGASFVVVMDSDPPFT